MRHRSFDTPEGILDVEISWTGRERVLHETRILSDVGPALRLVTVHHFTLPALAGETVPYEIRHLDFVGWVIKRDGQTIGRSVSRGWLAVLALGLSLIVLDATFTTIGYAIEAGFRVLGADAPVVSGSRLPDLASELAGLAAIPAAFFVARRLRARLDD